MTKAYPGDFSLSSGCSTHAGGGRVALLWLLLQYKTPAQDQICIKAQEWSVCKKGIRMLQRKMLGMWAERAGAEVAVTEKGWGCKALKPLPVSEGCEWVLTFSFLWFLLLPSAVHTPVVCCDFVFCDGVHSVCGLDGFLFSLG